MAPATVLGCRYGRQTIQQNRSEAISPERPMFRLAILVALMLASAAVPLTAAPAHAEATRTVGPYHISVSFASTPVYPEEANALIIQVAGSDGAPVTDLEHTLRLRVGVPNQVTETMSLAALPGRP